MRRHPAAHRRTARTPALVLALALVAGACSSDGDAATSATEPADGASGADRCDQGAAFDDLDVAPVAGVASDRTLTTADGTEIRLHWFPVAGATTEDPAPTILMGPGWSLPGDTSTEGAPLFGALSIPAMHEAGYHVLTWDPRGFGESTGVATVNHPDAEGQDVRALLDFVGAQPGVQLDDDGDPRAGMVGFSYGGGIQLTVAAIDCRVDALVPGIAWHSLGTSLYKAETVKSGWANVLTATVPEERLDPHIVSARDSGLADGTLSDEDREWFLDRGPAELVDEVEVPTLLIGGTVDTLFTLDETVTNYASLRERDVPVAMLWFCGGHGTCLTDPGDTERVTEATIAWLARHLRGDESVDTGERLELVDQHGDTWTAPDWPVDEGEPLEVIGAGALELTGGGGSGGIDVDGSADPMAGVVAEITPTRATNAVEVTLDAGDVDALALGAPELTITYSGEVAGDGPQRVFAQLVDDETGLVIGNQITPIAVQLDGEERTTTVALEIVAHHVEPGTSITLQLVAATTAYALPALDGVVRFTSVELTLPLASGATAVD